jgi:hypothetical protein
MVLMRVENTANGLEITEEMILNSLDTFTGKPVVLNKNREFRDYTDDKIVKEFQRENCVGVITDVKYNKDNKVVLGLVTYNSDEYDNCCYDNWQIDYEKGDDRFVFCAVEIFDTY